MEGENGQGYIDDTVDTQDSGNTEAAVADGGSKQADDNYSALQDRMAGEVEDTPWYSPSEGKVVDNDGRVLTDANGQPYRSMSDYEKARAQQASTAKPKTPEAKQPPKPMSRSFDAIMAGEQPFTPERLFELSKAGGEYKYADELIPKIEQVQQQVAAAQQQSAPTDPVEVVNQQRAQLDARMVQPLVKVRQWLLSQGADAALVDAQIGPMLKEQQELIESHYKTEYQKALEEKLARPVKEQQSKLESERTQANAMANIERVARAYWPKEGKENFFALINGHYETGADGKEAFVRGPSAQILDLLSAVSNDGKSFKTAEERTTAYANMFHKISADPAKARALVDIAYNYWLGRKAAELQKLSYTKGKQAAQQTQQRVQRTIKTKPASYQQPSTDEDEKGMPLMLKQILAAGG
jgi:hypothetical protein